MRGKRGGSFFTNTLLIEHSTMDDISHDHPELPRYKLCFMSAVRSCGVFKGHQNVVFESHFEYVIGERQNSHT